MALILNNERFRKLLLIHPLEALRILYEQYHDALLRLAVRLTHDAEAAHDMVHDAYLSVWDNRRKLAEYHGKSIENYLARIIRNRAVSYYRRRRAVDIDLLLAFRDLAAEEDPVTAMIRDELYREFRAFIAGLPMRQRQAIEMRIDRDMSLDEIAGELGVSRKMVENSQTAAMKKLRAWASEKK